MMPDARDFYCGTVAAMSRVTHRTSFLWDTSKKHLMFLSGDFYPLGGASVQSVYDLSFDGYYDFVSEECRDFLKALDSSMVGYFEDQPLHDEMQSPTLYLHFFFGDNSRKKALATTVTCLKVGEDGHPLILLGDTAPSGHGFDENFALLFDDRRQSCFMFNHENSTWEKIDVPKYSENEKMMLRLSMSGLDTNAVAAAMNRTVKAVNYYRACVFEKMHVKSITAAIVVAMRYGII